MPHGREPGASIPTRRASTMNLKSRIAKLEKKLPPRPDDSPLAQLSRLRVAGIPRCVYQARVILLTHKTYQDASTSEDLRQQCLDNIRAIEEPFQCELEREDKDLAKYRGELDAAVEILEAMRQEV